MNINEAITLLEKQIVNPSESLPEEIFLFVSRITPLVNVDLLIKDENGRILLAWRDDLHYCGWHIPGGILRFNEMFEKRIQKVAEMEIGMPVKFDAIPIAINQTFLDQNNTRGHFISLLYNCFLSSIHPLKNKDLKEGDSGFLKWHDSCPTDLLNVHGIYKKFFKENLKGNL